MYILGWFHGIGRGTSDWGYPVMPSVVWLDRQIYWDGQMDTFPIIYVLVQLYKYNPEREEGGIDFSNMIQRN